MHIVIRPSAEAAAFLAAEAIAQALRANPGIVLGLATGRTMESVYARLVYLHLEENLDFSACHTFNLDEYVGLSRLNRNSYRYYMHEHLFRHVNINLQNTHLPDGEATDLDAECLNYERLIAKCGGIDLQLLGIGQNGHLGFNEPQSPFHSRTRVETLSDATISQNSPLFLRPGQMPKRAITMGLGSIFDCRQCILIATGNQKAEIIFRTLEGPITNLIPATILQKHRKCLIILDEIAAGLLKKNNHHESGQALQPISL